MSKNIIKFLPKYQISQDSYLKINKIAGMIFNNNSLNLDFERCYNNSPVNNDLIEVADALGDMLYILCGTIIEHGMQDLIEDVFDEIQKSNMSKLGLDGNPIYREDGKVMKGPNYFKPNFSKFFK